MDEIPKFWEIDIKSKPDASSPPTVETQVVCINTSRILYSYESLPKRKRKKMKPAIDTQKLERVMRCYAHKNPSYIPGSRVTAWPLTESQTKGVPDLDSKDIEFVIEPGNGSSNGVLYHRTSTLHSPTRKSRQPRSLRAK